jgi:hypothetical protein
VDVAWLFDFTGNLDCYWEHFGQREWFEGLASFGRLILHDRRGTGLSSRDRSLPNLETRVAESALAGPSQVLVSQTVRELVAGSGFTFEPAGEHELKGVPGPWRVYAVA